MSKFLDKKYSNIEPYVPGEQPRNVNKLVKLNTNENPFPPSPKVVDVIKGEEGSRLNLYSDPTCDILVKAVAEHFGLEPEQVVAGNGSDEILAFCFQGFCEEGAVYNDITYGFYEVFAGMYGAASTVVPLKDDFSIDIEDYKGLKGTVFITNPNAPTGRALGLDKIEELLCQDRDRLVVVDEAYIDFGGESAVKLIGKYDNLLVIQTFSKSRSLAGARLGIALGNAEIISDMNALKFSFNPYNINRITMLAGIEAIRDDEYFEKTRKTIMANRAYTVEKLTELGFSVIPSAANFIFASPSGMECSEYFTELRKRNIIVRYWNKARIKDWTRITIGTEEQMKALIEATEEILKQRG